MPLILRLKYETANGNQFHETGLKLNTHFYSFNPGQSPLPFLVFKDEKWTTKLIESKCPDRRHNY